MNKQELKELHDSYIERVRASGGKVLAFDAPCCGESIETPAPTDPFETWDTYSICLHCETGFLKITRSDGAVGYLAAAGGTK